ncbi:hypothetical protein Fcan01_06581 [Folsomia candida]|uniref:Ionotropic glutamate receptor C-terminal domain-containing protein n=1 Tax=Folsomia candida TaxID=158441 RepID=A0A226EJM2_FOLCA|nr:hypothetical protein Fcan01_06581 [Folsomia candida]
MVDNQTDSIDQLVIHDEAEIAISQTTLTLDTFNDTHLFLTYLQPTSNFRYFAILTQPPARTIRNVVTMPFAPSMWLAYGFMVLIIFITVITSQWITRRFIWNDNSNADIWTISDAFCAVIATVCQQELQIVNNKTNAIIFDPRLIMWTAYVTGTALYIGYSAIIISFISADNLVPIRTAEELKSSSLPIYGDGDYRMNPYVYEGVVDTTDPRNILSPEEALAKLQTEVGAYLGFSDAYTAAGLRMGLTEDFLCRKFSHIPFSKIDYKSSMFVKKGSPYREFFNYRIIAGKEFGLNHRYIYIYSRNAAVNCPPKEKSDQTPLEVRDILLPFLFNFFGICSSFLIFVGEKLTMRSLEASKVQVFEYPAIC